MKSAPRKGTITTSLQVEPPIICTAAHDLSFCIKRGDATIQIETRLEAEFLMDFLRTAKKHLP